MNWYTTLVNKLPNWLQAAWNTAVFTFIFMFGSTSLGWAADLSNALRDGTDIPSLSVLASAAIAAVTAAGVGFINAVVRWGQGVLGIGSLPAYTPSKPAVDTEGFTDYPKG